ncbi:multiple epidermal growth factor-like domains protein 10 [Saccostrea cucullata]|uniref:multiple epidermal growth factor-like domains protein 10 n=1 Tax=Saccostrea cuccullata TaxID=36930 RepID=UPI002ED5A865
MSINPTTALFILLCAIDELPIVSNIDGCLGHVYGCCVGFVWNQQERACVKCQNGYSGINCSEICQYPNYGEDCQNECNCTQEMCDPSKGCQDISTGNAHFSMAPDPNSDVLMFVQLLFLSLFGLLSFYMDTF